MSGPSDELPRYYAARAREYESVYAKPERQADLARLRDEILPNVFRGRSRVLDVACGTGYWTPVIAHVAKAVHGVDIGDEVLEVAQAKIPQTSVTGGTMSFSRADAFALPDDLGEFDGAFVGFFWSHIPRAEIQRFLRSLHRRLPPGAIVLILDNRFVSGSSTPLSRRDPLSGDTYQMRTLNDGSTHEVLKIFPTEAELRDIIEAHGSSEVRYEESEYFWAVRYQRGRP